MLNQRKKSHPLKLGMNKKSSIPVKNKTLKPKQEWNSYLTDADQYKATKEDLLKKKQLLVSKHNILADNNDVVVASNRSPRLIRTPTSTSISPTVPVAVNNKENSKNDDVDALDLLEEHNTPQKSSLLTMKKKRNINNTSTKNMKKKSESDIHNTINTKKNRHTSFDSNNSKHMMDDDDVSELDSIRTSTNTTVMNTPSPNKQRFHANTTTGTTKSSSKPSKYAHTTPPSTAEKDGDLVYVADEIRALFSELKYYEELSGRQSIVDTREELEEMLEDKALLDPTSHKPIMRYLTQLVCQSLTYLLKSEVDLQDQRQKYQQLSAQYHTLNDLLSPDSGIANVVDITAPLVHTSSTTGGGSSTGGIAYCSDDLYPQSLSNWGSSTGNTNTTTPASATTANATTSAVGMQTPTRRAPTVETSSELRRLTQAYAQDDLYPVPTDTDIDTADTVQYTGGQYTIDYTEDNEKEDVLTALPNNSTTSMHTDSKLTAKVTSTPARFLDHIADPSMQATARTAKLAANLPPGMTPTHLTVHSTPTRSQSTSAVYPYTGSSTCSTPPVHHHHMKYTAPHTVPTTPVLTSNTKDVYPHLNTPASYVDAYSSYLPSTPKQPLSHSKQPADLIMHSPSTPQHTPQHSVYPGTNYRDSTEHLTADLSRVDALIEYSRCIATTPITGLYSRDDEFSTISRLADSFAAHRSPTTADDSMLSGAADRSSMYTTSTSAADVDVSLRQVGASHEAYMRMYDSQDSVLSAPAPPSTQAHTTTTDPYVTPFRQPVMANSSREALQRQAHVNNSSTGNSSSGNSSSVPQDVSLSSMPGTSASDWLFSAFPSKPSQGDNTTTATADIVTPPVTYSSASMSVSKHSSTPTQQSQLLNTASTTNTYHNYTSNPTRTHQPQLEQESDATIDRLTQQLCTRLNIVTPPTPPTRVASTPVTHDLYTQKQLYNHLPTPPPVYTATSKPPQTTVLPQHKTSIIPTITKSTIQSKHTTSTKPLSTKLQQPLPPQQQEQGSIISPLPTPPSPHTAPVHPFAASRNMHHIY